jgi:hypothetical protein
MGAIFMVCDLRSRAALMMFYRVCRVWGADELLRAGHRPGITSPVAGQGTVPRTGCSDRQPASWDSRQ